VFDASRVGAGCINKHRGRSIERVVRSKFDLAKVWARRLEEMVEKCELGFAKFRFI
jgi:hypothetical protein